MDVVRSARGCRGDHAHGHVLAAFVIEEDQTSEAARLMPRPLLSKAVTWADFEDGVLKVIKSALAELGKRSQLPRTEDPINFELRRELLKAHSHASSVSPGGNAALPFSILFESSSQPELDDTVRSARLRKRPDLTCVLFDAQALDPSRSQLYFYVECKRLGKPEKHWVLNDNYHNHGIGRFVSTQWQYAKNCSSAAMVGYVQNQDPKDVIVEVNRAMRRAKHPTLKGPPRWTKVAIVGPVTLKRPFHPRSFRLHHLWLDARACTFVDG